MNRNTALAAIALVVGLGAAACATPERAHVLRQPSVQFAFGELSEDEQQLLINSLTRDQTTPLDCKQQKAKVICALRLVQGELDPAQFFAQLADLHQLVASVKNPAGSLLAQSESVNVQFNYTTTHAESVTGAVIFITPMPSNAALFIDSTIPGLAQFMNPDGSARLGDSGQFSIDLPFSFIRQRHFLYFRTVHEGATRFFFYDLDRQQQFEVGEIRSEEDWRYFQEHHALP